MARSVLSPLSTFFQLLFKTSAEKHDLGKRCWQHTNYLSWLNHIRQGAIFYCNGTNKTDSIMHDHTLRFLPVFSVMLVSVEQCQCFYKRQHFAATGLQETPTMKGPKPSMFWSEVRHRSHWFFFFFWDMKKISVTSIRTECLLLKLY